MHLFPQKASFRTRNVNISFLNEIFWDTEQVHSGISEIGLLVMILGLAAIHEFKFKFKGIYASENQLIVSWV